MVLVFRSLVLALTLAVISAAPFFPGQSTGNSEATITFVNNRRPDWSSRMPTGGGGSFQTGETNATSVQTSTGTGQQTNQGQATAVSMQNQTDGSGATQTTSNQGVIQAFQQTGGNCSGAGTQTSDNQANIQTSQLQQNVDGVRVDVDDGNQGILFVNTNDRARQAGETNATSVQTSSGPGQQTNQGQATAVSVQEQTGLSGATQTANNQGVIQALQEAGGNCSGAAGGTQSSNNQINIQSNQLQQNVDGVLVNVNEGNQGVVIINTNDQTGAITNQTVINDKPIAPSNQKSVKCRHVCRRPLNGKLYCCDDGTNIGGKPAIHGGQCPEARLLCLRQPFVRRCAHDGQCEASDKCCYDACVDAHICKSADPVV